MINLGTVHLYTVTVEHLAISITLINIILVIRRIRLLNTPSRRRIETRDGKTYSGTVVKELGLLDKPLAE